MTRLTHHSDPRQLAVRRWMAHPAEVRFSAKLEEVADRLLFGNADAVLVMHDDGNVAGLITERELVFGAQAEAEGARLRAGDVATHHFLFVREEDSLWTAVALMADHDVRLAVVVDADDAPVGLLSLAAGPVLARLLQEEERDDRLVPDEAVEPVEAS